jgi:hypothetical protein
MRLKTSLSKELNLSGLPIVQDSGFWKEPLAMTNIKWRPLSYWSRQGSLQVGKGGRPPFQPANFTPEKA